MSASMPIGRSGGHGQFDLNGKVLKRSASSENIHQALSPHHKEKLRSRSLSRIDDVAQSNLTHKPNPQNPVIKESFVATLKPPTKPKSPSKAVTSAAPQLKKRMIDRTISLRSDEFGIVVQPGKPLQVTLSENELASSSLYPRLRHFCTGDTKKKFFWLLVGSSNKAKGEAAMLAAARFIRTVGMCAKSEIKKFPMIVPTGAIAKQLNTLDQIQQGSLSRFDMSKDLYKDYAIQKSEKKEKEPEETKRAREREEEIAVFKRNNVHCEIYVSLEQGINYRASTQSPEGKVRKGWYEQCCAKIEIAGLTENSVIRYGSLYTSSGVQIPTEAAAVCKQYNWEDNWWAYCNYGAIITKLQAEFRALDRDLACESKQKNEQNDAISLATNNIKKQSATFQVELELLKNEIDDDSVMEQRWNLIKKKTDKLLQEFEAVQVLQRPNDKAHKSVMREKFASIWLRLESLHNLFKILPKLEFIDALCGRAVEKQYEETIYEALMCLANADRKASSEDGGATSLGSHFSWPKTEF